MSVKATAALLLLFALGSVCPAQESPGQQERSSFGVIVYATGEMVTIIRDGRPSRYDAYTGEPLGLPVYPGDMIQTDAGTYVEIQLLPSRSLIKVAENTAFTVEELRSSGDGVFSLTYGRLRARVNRLAGSDPFEIRGVGAIAGVRGTDFGTDEIALLSGGGSVTRVYCFEGEVSVVPTVAPADADPVILGPNQMVRVDVPVPAATAAATAATTAATTAAATAATTPVPEPIPSGIVAFWQREDFVAEPVSVDDMIKRFPALEAPARELLRVPLDAAPAEEGMTGSAEPGAVEAVQQPQDAAAVTAVEPRPEPIRAPEAVAVEGGDRLEDMSPERRVRLARNTKVIGFTLAGVGFAADAAAAGLYFFGDRLFPDWPAASDPDVLMIVGAAGGVYLIGGIMSLLLSLQLSR